jgi:hypothetical protein
MKLETKQNEVRLLAETDLDKYYLENFFDIKNPLYVVKSYNAYDDDECMIVSLIKEKPE